jgi:hypothetical protein
MRTVTYEQWSLAALAAVAACLWPTAAQAHGFPPVLATLLLATLLLWLAAQVVADYVIIRRLLARSSGNLVWPSLRAALLGTLAMALTATGAQLIWEQARFGLFDVLNSRGLGGALFNTHEWWVSLLAVWLISLLVKSLVVTWMLRLATFRQVALRLGLVSALSLGAAGLAAWIYVRLVMA